VGFKPAIPAFELAKIVNASDRAATLLRIPRYRNKDSIEVISLA
jgi:hypothetical protein